MRDLFEDIAANQPLDPTEAARRAMRPQLRRRFYTDVSVAEGADGFALALDGRPVKTPARRSLAAPVRDLAEPIAEEWRSQRDRVDPATMPATRLANTIIDGVADAPGPVADEITKFCASDLLFYRADQPEALAVRQAQAWDPLLVWVGETLGAGFVVGQGMAFVAQADVALAVVQAALPGRSHKADIWRLGALHSVTTLTGSALIGLAVMHGRVTAAEAWAAAHVDEDWNMETWGRDTLALERRAFHFAEMQAAARVLEVLHPTGASFFQSLAGR